jgi:hypothetical protein
MKQVEVVPVFVKIGGDAISIKPSRFKQFLQIPHLTELMYVHDQRYNQAIQAELHDRERVAKLAKLVRVQQHIA